MTAPAIPPGAPINTGKLSALTMNGLGDSIMGAQSNYTVFNTPAVQNQIANNIPAWTPSTAYALGNVVSNGGYQYYCTTAGTSAASGGPGGTTTATDGTVVWTYNPPLNIQKRGTSMFFWAEAFSLGTLQFDMTQGYGGYSGSLLKVIVISGGQNYSSGDTVTFNNGGVGTLVISGGVIIGVNVTNCGWSSTAFTYTINSSTGSGAVLSLVQGGSGTFGVPGCWTRDMVARLPDCLASTIGLFVVHGGTNDVVNFVAPATIIANLQTCYETLMAAGRKVIAVPITPRAISMTGTVPQTIQRVNRWIRAYCRGEAWANPNGYNQIALADPTTYLCDGTNGGFYPIGGTGGVLGAVTQDGLHPSHRGAMYYGYTILQAALKFVSPNCGYSPRACSADDGYDLILNPGGNMLEGVAWQPNTAYVVGQQCSNSGNVYRCSTAGTSASSGGPSGLTTSNDGTAVWTYIKNVGLSTLSGTRSAAATIGGVTVSGNLATSNYLTRNSGSASGTVVCSVESPWSNGQKGQRERMVFSLGSGSAAENWMLYLITSGETLAYANVQPADLGVTRFQAEVELEITGAANLSGITFMPAASSVAPYTPVQVGPNIVAAGFELVPSSGDPMPWPNGGKLLLRTPPFILPPNSVQFNMQLILSFNASGAAGSATANVAVNYWNIHKYGVL